MLLHLSSIGTDCFYYCKYKVKWHTQGQKGQQPPWFTVCCFNTQDDPFQLATFPFPDGKMLPSYNTKITATTKSTADVFFTLCLCSSSLFLGLYTGINYLNFLLSWSGRSPVTTKRGIRLQRNLPAGDGHYLPEQSQQQKHVQPVPAMQPLGFHLLPWPPKSAPPP